MPVIGAIGKVFGVVEHVLKKREKDGPKKDAERFEKALRKGDSSRVARMLADLLRRDAKGGRT